jgi:hypothetical protein
VKSVEAGLNLTVFSGYSFMSIAENKQTASDFIEEILSKAVPASQAQSQILDSI